MGLATLSLGVHKRSITETAEALDAYKEKMAKLAESFLPVESETVKLTNSKDELRQGIEVELSAWLNYI